MKRVSRLRWYFLQLFIILELVVFSRNSTTLINYYLLGVLIRLRMLMDVLAFSLRPLK
jgi:hypothetical protein